MGRLVGGWVGGSVGRKEGKKEATHVGRGRWSSVEVRVGKCR